MNKKFLSIIVPCIAALTCLTACDGGGKYKPDTKHIDSYYADCNLDLFGPYLEVELQRHMFKKHTVFVKYSQFASYCKSTADRASCDLAPSTRKNKYTKQKNEYFYTGNIAKGTGTREHVWPCANSDNLWVHNSDAGKHYVDSSTYKGGGSDLYHVRPCDSDVNSARGNSKYCDFDDPEFESFRSGVTEVGDGGPYKLKLQGLNAAGEFADRAEPADEMKGDIVRILVYVYLHYGSRGNTYNHADMIGNLSLTNVFAYGNDIDRVREKIVEWNEIDPPSDTEKLRNDTVEGIQGNRNPLVDHPELINQLFE